MLLERMLQHKKARASARARTPFVNRKYVILSGAEGRNS